MYVEKCTFMLYKYDLPARICFSALYILYSHVMPVAMRLNYVPLGVSSIVTLEDISRNVVMCVCVCVCVCVYYSDYIKQCSDLAFVLQGAQKISIPYTPNKPVTVKQILR
jgi:hypothetical protein